MSFMALVQPPDNPAPAGPTPLQPDYSFIGEPFSTLFGEDVILFVWNTMLPFLMLLVCIKLITLGMRLMTRPYIPRSRHPEERWEVARREQRAAELEARNRAEVQGIDYGLRSGIITARDLQSTEPAEIQRKLDLDNPFAPIIVAIGDTLAMYSRATRLSRRDQHRKSKMHEQLRELREAPEQVQLKALARHTDGLIAEAVDAVQAVRELPEG